MSSSENERFDRHHYREKLSSSSASSSIPSFSEIQPRVPVPGYKPIPQYSMQDQYSDRPMNFGDVMIQALDNEPDLLNNLRRRLLSDMVAQLESRDRVINELMDRVYTLELKCDENEQQSRNDTVRISGIPELSAEQLDQCDNKQENVESTVTDLFKSRMSLDDFDESEIEKSFRVPKKDASTPGPRSIVVKFAGEKSKRRVMKSRKQLAVKDDDVTTPKISINHDITAIRSEAAYEARKMKRNELIEDTWVDSGKVIVKDKKQKKHVIRHKDELSKIPVNENRNQDENPRDGADRQKQTLPITSTPRDFNLDFNLQPAKLQFKGRQSRRRDSRDSSPYRRHGSPYRPSLERFASKYDTSYNGWRANQPK